MLKIQQMFLFLLQYRWKSCLSFLCFAILVLSACSLVEAKCSDTNCSSNGVCKNETCVCFEGWQGDQCQYCGGKVRLGSNTGIIYDGLGNYSVGAKCSWLIDAPNNSITIHLEEFATECGWDHFYIFDGDSVDSPLLAAFSGLMYKNGYGIRRIPEVVASSGSALVHFSSDEALIMSGFNVTYRLNACPSKISGLDCSGNGICIDQVCTCNGTWTGAACHLEKCPDNCGVSQGRGMCEPEFGCKCSKDYIGDDCGQETIYGYWETVMVQGFVPAGSASHGAVIWRDSMYVIAGKSYDTARLNFNLYDFNGNSWETHQLVSKSYDSSPRYGHSTVIYGDKVFLYGGVLEKRGPTSEVWVYDISTNTWENITVKTEPCNDRDLMCGPLKSAGHTATVVINSTNKTADRMIVLFGHSPHLGYLNTVQEYYFGTREWHIVATRGYAVKGGYGHTSTWDPLSGKIYVYGGVVSENKSSQVLSKSLYSYDPNTRVWVLLRDAPSARFLHTATFISDGLMLVFGGNTHNHDNYKKCYSLEFLAYDVICDTWQELEVPKNFYADLSRFGHSAVVFEGSLYIFGGFDGEMMSDMLKYTPGDCSFYTSQNVCLNRRSGVKCVWNTRNNLCTSIRNITRNISDDFFKSCPESNIIQNEDRCEKLEDCLSCTQTTNECSWCGGTCVHNKKCRNSLNSKVVEWEQCPLNLASICKQLHTCSACIIQPFCLWRSDNAKCVTRSLPSNVTDVVVKPIQCQKVCSGYSSCHECTQGQCIWCQNEGRCVDINAYIVSFPYGQCREWITDANKCRSRGSNISQCNFYSTCTKCRDNPACGWCDDGSSTGLGKCMPGGNAGPTLHTSSTCPSDRWHFTTCPLCQCNGHASCVANSSTCLSCSNLTTGSQCEHCVEGYWGNPVNGGICQLCKCNGKATHCLPESGKCYCTTKGLIGDHCDKCDVFNHYYSDPINSESCYYDIDTDYQYTFNLSKKTEIHYTQINFRNFPSKADLDVDFYITCSVPAKMNITIRQENSKGEKRVHHQHNCTPARYSAKFLKSDFSYGTKDNVSLTTFYVYLYNIKTPLLIQLSFTQYPKLNFYNFFR